MASNVITNYSVELNRKTIPEDVSVIAVSKAKNYNDEKTGEDPKEP